MRVVLLLKTLLARCVEIVAADGDNVVTAVCGWVIDRLVLAHEDEGNGRGKAAETAAVRADVHEVPCSGVGKSGLDGSSVRNFFGGAVEGDGEGYECWAEKKITNLSNSLRHLQE